MKRQIAAAFSLKAVEDLPDGARVVLILPAGALLSDAAQPFLQQWFRIFSPTRFVNLSDVRHLLFGKAVHPCVIAVGHRRPRGAPVSLRDEFLDYVAPKADVTLAFRRFVLYGADSTRIPVSQVALDNTVLRIHTWGTAADSAFLARLSLLGSLGEMSEWWIGKGMHFHDARVDAPRAVPAAVRNGRYIDAANVGAAHVCLDENQLKRFPAAVTHVPTLSGDGGAAYGAGPKVLFPDGADMDTFEVRATYTARQTAFPHTVSGITLRIAVEPAFWPFSSTLART